jgi:16S rRNA (uracil1498-N3)-methyltransferase
MKPTPVRRVGPRLFCDLALSPGAEVALPEATARHAVNVLRLEPGDALTLFNGVGGEYRANLVTVNKRGAWARIAEFHAT